MTTQTSDTILRAYRSAISQERGTGRATEHSYRPALKALVEALGGNGIIAINDPTHVDAGAPDFIVQRHSVPIGHIECKDIGDNLNSTEQSEQLQRYRNGLPNLILTDYLEFRWYSDGQLRDSARLGSVDSNGNITQDTKETHGVTTLLDTFFNAEARSINSPQDLARRMAESARLLRDGIANILAQENESGPLHNYLTAYQKVLINGLTQEDFADMQAQTLAYGLFAARCQHNSTTDKPFTRQSAVFTDTTPFLRDVFLSIAGPSIDPGIAWVVDNLALLLDHADMAAILADFGNRTGDHDPIVHFYEDFLHAYDPKLREMRGVYYTPEPVVSYIVRSINALLQDSFSLKDGLADIQTIPIEQPSGSSVNVPKVLILDPAAGTGTFLREVVCSVRNTITERGMAGAWPDYVRDHLLPRLFGFELLMAPYAICHLKLALEIAGANASFSVPAGHRINVFLTNTLEEPHETAQGQMAFMPHAIAQESASADAVKRDQPVMVVLGNPPYSGHSANKGQWIRKLLRGRDGIEPTGNYFQVDGARLEERNPQWLNDDYVKFIRYAQRRIERTGEGVLGFVTNHSYLDNPTFRGMRQNLMETFDDIYLLDLHGNSKRKEQSPDGSKDENVFDIQQGVAIGLFVKRKGTPEGPAQVHHADLYGERESKTGEGKYGWLAANDVRTTKWTELTPQSPRYLFIPRDEALAEEYEAGWSIPEIFPVNSAGIVTARDRLTIQWSQSKTIEVAKDFAGMSAEKARSKYELGKDVRDWKVGLAQDDLNKSGLNDELVKPVLYRPFDTRYTYYTGNTRGFICMPRREVMRHMLMGKNIGLITCRQQTQTDTEWSLCGVSHTIIESSAISNKTREINSLFPLYTHPTEEQKRLGQIREPNLNPEFIETVASYLDLDFITDDYGDLQNTIGPQDIFHFIYAVLHSPEYRRRYAGFLKSDFARVPLTKNLDLFTALTLLGQRMTSLHLMESSTESGPSYPVLGNNRVDRVQYIPPKDETPGRVYINKDQYFEGITTHTWEFTIGSYRPADKWLKDRKGRTLTFDDVGHYRRIAVTLSETQEIMVQIDQTIDYRGGWPMT